MKKIKIKKYEQTSGAEIAKYKAIECCSEH